MVTQRIFFIFISLNLLIVLSLKSQVTKIDTIDTMPVFNGNMFSFIQEEIQYPDSAIKDSIEGAVYVDFSVEKDGKTTQHTIVRGIRQDLDDEALRVSKLIKFKTPAMLNGKPAVLSRYLLRVRFILPIHSEKEKQVNDKKEKNNRQKKPIPIKQYDYILPVIYYAKNDSCFCAEYSAIYDNPDEIGFGVPEKDITGKHFPLELIEQNARYVLLQEIAQNDNFDELFIIMRIVVDKEGKVRCGMLLKGNDDIYAKKVFESLSKEGYLPAQIRGRDIVYHYYFIFKL